MKQELINYHKNEMEGHQYLMNSWLTQVPREGFIDKELKDKSADYHSRLLDFHRRAMSFFLPSPQPISTRLEEAFCLFVPISAVLAFGCVFL